MVERPPPRPLTDEFGLEILNTPRELITLQSPTTDSSPTNGSSTTAGGGGAGGGVDSQKPVPSPTLPRPYIPRSRSSSNSILGVISPVSSSSPAVSLEQGHGSSTPTS